VHRQQQSHAADEFYCHPQQLKPIKFISSWSGGEIQNAARILNVDAADRICGSSSSPAAGQNLLQMYVNGSQYQ
jgi:citrate lyase beta subunit